MKVYFDNAATTAFAYIAAVRAAVKANVGLGYILEYDAKPTLDEAEASDLGRR